MFWLTILSLFMLFSLGWWFWADRKLKPLNNARRWRVLLALFMALHLGGFAANVLMRSFDLELPVPTPLLASVYIWHLIILPVAFALSFGGEIVAGLVRGIAWAREKLRQRTSQPGPEATGPSPLPLAPSRRQLLAAAGAAVPPLVTVGAVGTAMARLPDFRVRELTVRLADLPAALEGLRIAHVSDTHVGRFTRGSKLEAIVEATNQLDADLVLMTGDLIDFDLSDLPRAIEMARAFRSRYGYFMCEGNHDLIEDRRTFEETVLESGLPLLLNRTHTVRVRGQEVQIMGIPWGRAGASNRRDARIDDHVETVASLRRDGAFPILLAHHPHAFDAAAEAGIPLTLAGHTHGGQLMLTRNVGPGPMMYRYWSGLYEKRNASLVVSNGVGNWFPLRVNAPAEIVHITLRRREASQTA